MKNATDWPLSTCVANCVACQLSEKMQDCANCEFATGYGVRLIHLGYLKCKSLPEALDFLAEIQQRLPVWTWNAWTVYAEHAGLDLHFSE